MKIYLVQSPPLSSHELQYHILAHHLNTHPNQIEIDRQKKPKCTSHHIEFSVSHTKNYLIMAIHSEPVGVDIEALDRQISWAVFNRHRTPAINSFSAPPWPPSSLPIEQQKIWHWTRWEAHCKLTGTGLLFQFFHKFLRTCNLIFGKICACRWHARRTLAHLNFFV